MVVSSRPVASVRVAETVVPPRVVNAARARGGAAPLRPQGSMKRCARIAAEHSLSPQLIHSVIKVESNYNPHAISNKGALGLMQLIPATARRFGVTDVFNPVQNIQGGAKYLRYLLDLYDGNLPAGAGGLQRRRSRGGALRRRAAVSPKPELPDPGGTATGSKRRRRRRPSRCGARAGASVESKEAGPAHVVEIVQADGTVRYVSR